MVINAFVLFILVMLLIAALPTWPYSRRWGYYPSGGFALALIVLLIIAIAA
jgi:hypothetical protein